jgi:DNA-directed RNA polymerase specialized sigma24 family protein
MQRDLVERAMAGDHEAFSELARLVVRRLYAVARLILRDSDRAEDATQEPAHRGGGTCPATGPGR